MDNFVGPLFGVLCGGFFFLLFMGLGVFLIYRTQQSKKKAQLSQNWPATPGQITDSHVSRSQNTDLEGETTTSMLPGWSIPTRSVGRRLAGTILALALPQL